MRSPIKGLRLWLDRAVIEVILKERWASDSSTVMRN
jgi:hypothetical protein